MRTRLKVKEIAEAKGFNQSSLSRTANISFKDLIEDVVDDAEIGDKNTFRG